MQTSEVKKDVVRPKLVMGLSGGMDSSTVLAMLLHDGFDVHAFNFTYGSKHNDYEVKSAQLIADHYNIPYDLIDLSEAFSGFKSDLLKTGGDIPEGHYEADNMVSTVVPFRNSIFSMILAGKAESIGAEYIALGVHQGDHHIYPDCRKSYIKLLDNLIFNASEEKIEVLTPVLHTDKIGILQIGHALGVPYELTRTCYKDQEQSCGKCGSCVERLEAFEKNEMEEPIKYE